MKKLLWVFVISCTVADVIPSIRPGATWNMRGKDYSGLEWRDSSQTKPTLAEVNEAIATCKAKPTKKQMILDAKDKTKSADERIDALIKIIGL